MENKEEINKHLEGFVDQWIKSPVITNILKELKNYQKKHNLIPSIEDNKWYIIKNGIAFRKGDSCVNYGFWFGEWKSYLYVDETTIHREATQEEWQSLLLEKAKKDYPKWTEFISAVEESLNGFSYGLFKFDLDGDIICNGLTIFSHETGKWAEIIQEEEPKKLTVEEVERALGYKVEIISNK